MVAVDPVHTHLQHRPDPAVLLGVPGEGQQVEAVGQRHQPQRPLGLPQVEGGDAGLGQGGGVALQGVAVGPPPHRVDEPHGGIGPAGGGQVRQLPGAEPEAVDGPGGPGHGQDRFGEVGFLEVERQLEVGPQLGVEAGQAGHAELPQPGRREIADLGPPQARPHHRAVHQDDLAVGGQPGVGLQAGGADLQRPPEGGQGVLGGVGPPAPVGEGDRRHRAAMLARPSVPRPVTLVNAANVAGRGTSLG